ncbi:MAG: hypothetical protein LBS93_01685 [Synergistaceae bacterium]|nr:hypothetical protein [Synergistaceae bacterium]
MSVVTVSVVVAVSGYSVIQTLAMAAGTWLATGLVAAALKGQSDRMDGEAAAKQNLLAGISLEAGRLARRRDGDAGAELRKRLDALKNSLGELVKSDSGLASAIDELSAIQQHVRGAELDDAQCMSREQTVRELVSSLRSSGVEAYVQELDRLDDELERISALTPDHRLFELQGMLDELSDMEKLKDIAASGKSATAERGFSPAHQDGLPLGEMERRRRLVREIRDWAGRIAEIDAEEGEKLRSMLEKLSADTQFPDRLAQLSLGTKRTWATLRERAAASVFFSETLTEMINGIKASSAAGSDEGAALIRRCDTLQNTGKFIGRADFMALYEDIARFVHSSAKEIADAFLTERIERTLAEMGYELVADELPEDAENPGSEELRAIPPSEVCYLESPYEDYRVMLKADSGSVTTRLVRVEDDAKERDAGDELRDIEVGKKWCADFDKFLAKMKSQGLPIETSVRREPGEADLMRVKNTQSAKGSKRRGKRGRGEAKNSATGMEMRAGGEN